MPRGGLERSPSFRVALSGGASSANPIFHELYEGALDGTDVLQSKRAEGLVPATYFAASLAEFEFQLKSYLESRGVPAGTKAVLLVDGTPKRLAGSAQAAEDFVRDALAAAGLAPAPAAVDVPQLAGAGADGAPFHADVSAARALEPIFRDGGGDAVFVAVARRAVVDVVKAAAAAARFEGHLLAVPPALSGSAYTSAFSSLEEGGVPKTSRTRAPSATLWLAPLLSLAPLRLARQGFAVASAFALAGADWYLGFKLHVVEGYNEAVHRLMAPALAALRARAAELGAAREGEPLPAGVAAALAAALSMAGVACNVASTTTPGSGFEHAAAHALSFLRTASGRAPPPHGEAVAVCTVAAARALDFLLDLPGFDPARFRSLDREDTARAVLAALQAGPYGAAGGEPLRAAVEGAAAYHASQAWRKERKWREMRLEDFLAAALAAAGLPTGPGASLGEDELAWALRFAPFARHRFNTGNLLRWLGHDPVAACGLSQAAAAGAAPPGPPLSLSIAAAVPSVRLPAPAEEGAAASPSPHFRLFYQALAYEDVLGERFARLIPAQYYADSLEEFAAQVRTYAERRGWAGRRFVILTDGIRKKVAGSEAAADDAVMGALRAAGLDAALEDVCGVCGVTAATLAASAEHLPKLQALVARERASVLLCFSKGAVCDLMKHAVLQSKLDVPLLVVPPALTVTAFTSAFAVIDFSGAKRTLMSLAPTATFWLAPVLRMAPAFVNRAGFGDLLAGLLANGDWYLGFKMQMFDEYHELAYRLMRPFVSEMRAAAPGFGGEGALPPDVCASTSAALAMSGVVMSLASATTPLSGFEHVVSHALDFLRLTSRTPPALHGAQVAMACLASARAFDALLALEDPAALEPPGGPAPAPASEEAARARVEALLSAAPFFGGATAAQARPLDDSACAEVAESAGHFAKEHARKAARWNAFRSGRAWEELRASWPHIRERLAGMTARAPEVESLLKAAGLPLGPDALRPAFSTDQYVWAARFAPYIRHRFSIGDLLLWAARDPASTTALL
eukprot:tig00020960_g16589.t1